MATSSNILTPRGIVLCNSNFNRIKTKYSPTEWDFVKCTTLVGFKIHAGSISSSEFGVVVVSGLESIAAEAMEHELESLPQDFRDVLAIVESKGLPVVIAPVITWPKFSSNAKKMIKAAVESIREAYPSFTMIETTSRLSFEADQVHLTEACAAKILDQVLLSANEAKSGSTSSGTSRNRPAADTEDDDDIIMTEDTGTPGRLSISTPGNVKLKKTGKGVKRKATSPPASGSSLATLQRNSESTWKREGWSTLWSLLVIKRS